MHPAICMGSREGSFKDWVLRWPLERKVPAVPSTSSACPSCQFKRASFRLTDMHKLVYTHLVHMDGQTGRVPAAPQVPTSAFCRGTQGITGDWGRRCARYPVTGAAARSQAPSFPVHTSMMGPQKSTAVRTLHQLHLLQAESTSGSDQRAREQGGCHPSKALRRPPAAP